jgi:hypothetical protein
MGVLKTLPGDCKIPSAARASGDDIMADDIPETGIDGAGKYRVGCYATIEFVATHMVRYASEPALGCSQRAKRPAESVYIARTARCGDT